MSAGLIPDDSSYLDMSIIPQTAAIAVSDVVLQSDETAAGLDPVQPSTSPAAADVETSGIVCGVISTDEKVIACTTPHPTPLLTTRTVVFTCSAHLTLPLNVFFRTRSVASESG